MAACCKINEFDKTSQSFFSVPTSGNAGGSRSRDNCSCQHFEAEQGERKTRPFLGNKTRRLIRSVAFVKLSKSEMEEMILALLRFWKTVKKGGVRRRRIIIFHQPGSQRDSRVCLHQEDDVTDEGVPKSPEPHIWHRLLR